MNKDSSHFNSHFNKKEKSRGYSDLVSTHRSEKNQQGLIVDLFLPIFYIPPADGSLNCFEKHIILC